MSAGRGAAVALALACAALAACGDAPRLAALEPGAVVLAFGDSLTYGTGAGDEETYPAVLAALTGLDVVNEGLPGETSAAGLERLPDLLDRVAPRLLVLCHGGNDFLRRRDLGETERNLRAMIDEARRRGVEVVLLGVPAPGLLLSSAALYARVAEAAGVPIDDDVVPSILSDRSLKSDAIHPNATGYRRLAEAVRRLLVEHGALRAS
jgi:lysophospholipase L1-like esterase